MPTKSFSLNKLKPAILSTIAFASLCLASQGAIVFSYDQNVTNNIIFGTGVLNGGFTLARDATSSLEIGLRARQRLPQPLAVYNSNGAGNYTFPVGAATTGASWIDSNTPAWNFEWSVNTNYLGTSGPSVGAYTYRLSLDSDPGVGTNFLIFDPIAGINPGTGSVLWGHSFGGNATTSANDSTAATAASYTILLGNQTLVQNSWNYEFFDDAAPLSAFLPVAGQYTIQLEVLLSGVVIGSNSINVIMVPEPTILAMAGLLCIAGLGIRRRMR